MRAVSECLFIIGNVPSAVSGLGLLPGYGLKEKGNLESALKAYSKSWQDPKDVYKERRWHILIRLPTLAGWELEAHIKDLNEDVKILNDKIRGCEEALKRKDIKMIEKERLKTELGQLKTTLKWVKKERKIYVFEKTRRFQ